MVMIYKHTLISSTILNQVHVYTYIYIVHICTHRLQLCLCLISVCMYIMYDYICNINDPDRKCWRRTQSRGREDFKKQTMLVNHPCLFMSLIFTRAWYCISQFSWTGNQDNFGNNFGSSLPFLVNYPINSPTAIHIWNPLQETAKWHL